MHVKWNCHVDNGDHKTLLEDLLPPDFNYKITKFREVPDPEDPHPQLLETKFESRVFANACNMQALSDILMAFGSSTNTSYNQSHSDRKNGKNVVTSGFRKCMHQVRTINTHEYKREKTDDDNNKHTDCQAKITFKLMTSKTHHHNEDCEEYPLRIDFKYIHNHPIQCAASSKHHPVSNDTKARFLQWFEEGESASSAHRHNKEYLKAHFKENYHKIKSNRSYEPGYTWVFNTFSKFTREKFGRMNGPESIAKAHEHKNKYNQKHGAELCAVKQFDDGHFVCVIHDPLTLRVHANLPAAGDLVMVDSTSSLDRTNAKYFRFLTPSPAGGLPMGAMITSRETKAQLKEGFTLYRDTLPENAFYKRGNMRGPSLFMTDDCSAEISALAEVWPESKQILCTFHLLQANWRWVYFI